MIILFLRRSSSSVFASSLLSHYVKNGQLDWFLLSALFAFSLKGEDRLCKLKCVKSAAVQYFSN